MRLRIIYRAEYRYAEPVSFSPHVIRLFPRESRGLRVESSVFSTNGSAVVQWRRDLFDNLTARCFYPDAERSLGLACDAELVVQEYNPFEFLLESRALRWPVEYDPREAAALASYRTCHVNVWPDELSPTDGSDTVESIVMMNQWIHANIAYERREEGEAFAPRETLQRGRGACRDTAVLLAAILRFHGLGARLVSGYLWESTSDVSARRADSALHAWTEVYLPGAGWLGLDPSNGVLSDHHYAAAAVGLAPEDIAPVTGLYYGDYPVPGDLEVSLTVQRL
jgi:transglutaminase-like putative cysteine protease